MEKLVIIPTYNESENISNILKAVFSLHKNYHVLIIDDGSPDDTAGTVKSLMAENPGRLYLEERQGKLGLGTAYIHGFHWAIKKGYQFVFEMDADFSHNPNDLEHLYEACKTGNADMSIGSRYIEKGKIENWPLLRGHFQRSILYTRLITGIPIKDPTAGFVCYNRKVLEAINLDEITFVGYAFQIEMKFAAWKLGFTIKEVPITFIDRQFGASKMNKGIVKEGILGVLKLKWMSMFKNYRRRVTNSNDLHPSFQQHKIVAERK